MVPPKLPPQEAARLERLRSYAILDTPPEEAFDDLVHLAAHVAQTPIALISLIDSERQWFKARYGLAAPETPRSVSFCAHAILQEEALIIEDTHLDARFVDNPLVTANPWIRFYAGFQLRSPDGYKLGTLCVIDRQPRRLDAASREALLRLARQVIAQLELRRNAQELRDAQEDRAAQSATRQAVLAALPGLFFRLSSSGVFLEYHGRDSDDLLVPPAVFLGRSFSEILPEDVAKRFQQAIRQAHREQQVQILGYELELQGVVRTYEARVAPAPQGETMVLIHDESPRAEAEQRLRALSELQSAMVRIQEDFILNDASRQVFNRLLDAILKQTESRFGFLGETLEDEAGQPYLRTFAISDIAWDQASADFYREHVGAGLEFRSLKTLFGEVLTTRVAVISNDPARDPRSRGVPEGHPRLTAFLGLPLFRGKRMVGMIGLANRPGGYDASALARLEPFKAMTANLIEAHRAVTARLRSEQALQESEARIRAVVDTATDAILTLDETGRIERVNPATARSLGSDASELVGSPIGRFVPALEGRAWALGRVRGEVWVRRADGSEFPAEITESPLGLGERTLTTWIIRDITERLKIARLQSEFISTVSHELRTPLTSIRGSLGLLAGGVLGALPSAAQEMIGIALNNSDRLVRLINDILDMEKIEAGRMDFNMETLELEDVLVQALEANAAYASAHGVRLLLETSTPGAVWADADRLAQVLANLLSNAVKFSPEGGVVTVRLRSDGDGLRVEVEDQGPGVPEEFRERLFERFSQADASDTRSKGGTGLGLSISRALVEHMQGQIGYAPAPGGGSIFFFTLPGQRPGLLHAPIVMLCSTSPALAGALGEALRHLSCQAYPVSRTEEARELLSARRCDLLLLDLTSGEACLALLEELRRTPQWASIPVIAIAGQLLEEDTHLGAFSLVDILELPLNEDRLVQAVTAAFLTSRSRSPRVLHVEDDLDLGRMMRRLLPPSWELIQAGSLQEAFRQMERSTFELILLDLSLPDGDGELLLDRVGDTPVVIFSAKDASPALARRVHAALVKTRTSAEDLRGLLVRILRRSEDRTAPL